ncbi:MAG: hypothetical protein IKY31_07370 [Bacteroidaceae bacterium]|nr:hypothetical protein [Bacteroidaceae bacterium]
MAIELKTNGYSCKTPMAIRHKSDSHPSNHQSVSTSSCTPYFPIQIFPFLQNSLAKNK